MNSVNHFYVLLFVIPIMSVDLAVAFVKGQEGVKIVGEPRITNNLIQNNNGLMSLWGGTAPQIHFENKIV